MENYKILVVDDDHEIADAIEIYLKSEGYEIFKAYNGLEALEILNQQKIHCILMDVMMPKISAKPRTFRSSSYPLNPRTWIKCWV